ncbi:MAG TPA: hypothetical protein VM680_20050 [Verrucomicrobiae bacterium]|nr:hypothetical protein [Verrucomicrobiae bacterium]
MKSFSKISSIIILAAAAAAFTSTAGADDIVVKPLRHQPPAKSQFVEKVKSTPPVTCPACKDQFVPAVTQDTKLRTKTILVASHACKECKTTVARIGAQKATGQHVTRHTCGALVAAATTCCGGMK